MGAHRSEGSQVRIWCVYPGQQQFGCHLRHQWWERRGAAFLVTTSSIFGAPGTGQMVALMNRSATIRFGSVPGTIPSNAGVKLPAEPLTEAEANALIAAIPSQSVTGKRNRPW